VDAAVFPGEQGGPHVNAMAGMAVAFKLARTPEFRQLQQQVVDNAKHLADELQKHGLRIPYGGTDTHMLLVDCKSIRADWGVSPDDKRGTPLMGDMPPASSTWRYRPQPQYDPRRPERGGPQRHPPGHPLGHPARLSRPRDREPGRDHRPGAQGCRPYAYAGRHGPVYRAKIDFDLLEQAKWTSSAWPAAPT